MKILSLFDGISTGQLAISKLGIPYTYFASEIDAKAIESTQINFPNTIQLGNVIDIDSSTLPKIDLLIAGSPCQGFSRSGKLLNFDDPRSKLFFEFVRILKEVKPTYFLLENVVMKPEFIDVITDFLGVKPVQLCASSFGAQIRERLFWANFHIPKITETSSITLSDVIGESCLPGAIRGRLLNEQGKATNDKSFGYTQCLEVKDRLKSNCLTTVNKDTVITNLPVGRYPNPNPSTYRFLTSTERMKLMNLPIDYLRNMSDNQILKATGNGWDLKTIEYILQQINFEAYK